MNNEFQIKWVGLLELRNHKLLMVREQNKQLLQLPGGSQEKGESDLDTLEREIKEELGVEIKNPIPYTDFILPGRNEDVKIKFVIYTADIPNDLNPGNDISDIVWIDSSYKEAGLDIGNPTKLILVERLKKEGLIN